MTEKEDDKKKLERDLKTVRDAEYTDTTHDQKQTVTTKEPTVTREEKVSWSQSPELRQYYEQQKKELQDAYHIIPETGDVDQKTLFGALGVNPELMRKNREEEMRRNRMKQKAAALYNSGALISDILSAGIGGNVWKREKDSTAKEAHQANLMLEREQAAEDAANAGVVNKTRDAYYKALQTLNTNMEKYNGVLRTTTGGGSSSTTTGGDTHTTKSGGGTHTTGWIESGGVPGNRSGANKGGGTGAIVGVMGSDGNLSTQDISKAQQDALGKHAASVYEKAIKDGDSELFNHFKRLGIVKKTKSGYDWDYTKLVESGYLFATSTKNPNISNSIKDYYRRAVGDTRDIVPVSTVQDEGYQPQDNKEEKTQTAGGL